MAQSLTLEPEALNLKLRQYQVWNQAFAYCKTDENGNYDLNSPIDLSGYTPLLQFRTSAMAKISSLQADIYDGSIVFRPDTCPQVQVSLGMNLAPGKYEWDLRLIPNDATESIFLGQGYALIQAEVSR